MAADRVLDTAALPGNGETSSGEASLGDTVARLGQAARGFAEAELGLARKRAAIIGGAARWIAVLGGIAFIVAFGMIVTLMIGAVLALSPHWGLGLSLLAVTGTALLAIIFCAFGIKAQIARIKEGTR
ncbi:MAG: phage holin family protein [Sphingobium sp.]